MLQRTQGRAAVRESFGFKVSPNGTLYQSVTCQAWHEWSPVLTVRGGLLVGGISGHINRCVCPLSPLSSPPLYRKVQSTWISAPTSSTASPGRVRRTRCASWPLTKSTSYGPSAKKSSTGEWWLTLSEKISMVPVFRYVFCIHIPQGINLHHWLALQNLQQKSLLALCLQPSSKGVQFHLPAFLTLWKKELEGATERAASQPTRGVMCDITTGLREATDVPF